MNTPIFKDIFSDDWKNLPKVLQKHYANRAYTDDKIVVEGVLDIMCRGPIKFLAPLFWLMKGIPPHNENNVTTTVTFKSNKNTAAFHFNRSFNFKTRKPYHFQSHMLQTKNNQVIEIMHFGFTWKINYLWQDNKVILQHRGYGLAVFGHIIPLPITAILGVAHAEEQAIDDHTFEMLVHITHPWWGRIYSYNGRFTVHDT